MLRTSLLMISLLGLVFQVGCGKEPVVDYSNLIGSWDGWGTVTFTSSGGTYSDTFKPAPGKINLNKTGDRSYEGTWGEGDDSRTGWIKLTLSAEGNTLSGTWGAHASSEITSPGDNKSQTVTLKRKQ